MAHDEIAVLRERLGKAEAERDHLRGMFDRLGQGFCELELIRDAPGHVVDFRYLAFNQAFERLFAIPVVAARGKLASELFPGLDHWWHDAYGRVADSGKPERLEHKVTALDRWFEVFAYPEGGDRLTLLFEDVTDRHRAERALKDSEERLALAIEVGRLASWDWDLASGTVTWNDRHFLLQGYQVGEVTPSFEAWLARVHPDDRDETVALIEAARDTHQLYTHIFRTLQADGSARWCAARGQFFYDADGEPVRMIGVMEDITERRRIEKALLQREADLTRVQRIGQVGGLDIDITGGMRSYRSPEYLRLHGLSADSAEETHADWVARVHPEDRARAEIALFDSLNGEATSYDNEYRIVRPSDHAVRWIHARADIERGADGSAVRLVGAHLDITDQKRLQEELREREERQGFLLRLSDALQPLSDPIAIEDTACRILGEHLKVDWAQYSEIDFKQGTITNHRDFFRASSSRHASLPSHVGTYDLSHYEIHALAWSAGRSLAIDDVAADTSLSELERAGLLAYSVAAALTVPIVKGGTTLAVMAALHSEPRAWAASDRALIADAADRTWAAVRNAMAESALKEGETRFRQFAEASSAGLWICRASDLSLEYVSPSMSAICGVEPDWLLGDVERWLDLVLPEDRDAAAGHLERARRGKSNTGEFRIVRSGAPGVRWVRSTCFPLRNGDEQVRRIGGTIEDVTEARAARDRQAMLLAELQHRVRNVFAVTRSIIARTSDDDRSIGDYVQHLDGRISALARTQALLTRSVGAGVDLHEMVADELLAQAAGAEQVEIEGPYVSLSANAAEILGLAIHELATNAIKYGALTVDAARVSIAWTVAGRNDVEWLVFRWSETGVPIITAESPQPGFGAELITQRIPYELKGRGELIFKPGGLEALIEFPLIVVDRILSRSGGAHG